MTLGSARIRPPSFAPLHHKIAITVENQTSRVDGAGRDLAPQVADLGSTPEQLPVPPGVVL